MTLEEDFTLLLDFALELDCGVTLEEDFAELLDATLEEDFALLLDFALELDCGVTLEEDFAELLDATLEEDFTLLLDFALELDFALTEEEDLAELLDTLVSPSLDCGVTLSLLDDSSSCGAKLLSSSQAAKNTRANPSKKRFIQKILLRYVVYLANFPSSLHPVFIIFPAKRIEHDD